MSIRADHQAVPRRFRRGPRRRLVEDRPGHRQGRRRRDRRCVRAVRGRGPARRRNAVACPPQRGRDVLRPRGRSHHPRRRRAVSTSSRATSCFAPRDVPHAYIVRSERARMLVTNSPAGVEQLFVSLGVPVTGAEPPDRGGDAADCPRRRACSQPTASRSSARRPRSTSSTGPGRQATRTGNERGDRDVQQERHARARLPRDGDADARHRGRQYRAAAYRARSARRSPGVQWVVDAYTLALATVVLSAGSLADRFGRRRDLRRRAWSLFTAASLACALAGSIACSTSRGRCRDSAPPMLFASLARDPRRRVPRRRVSGPARSPLYGATIGASFAVGPLVGGALTSAFSWRRSS